MYDVKILCFEEIVCHELADLYRFAAPRLFLSKLHRSRALGIIPKVRFINSAGQAKLNAVFGLWRFEFSSPPLNHMTGTERL